MAINPKTPSSVEGLDLYEEEKVKKSLPIQSNIPASFNRRLFARLVDNILYFVTLLLVLLVLSTGLGRYIFPQDFNQYQVYADQLSTHLRTSDKSANDIFLESQNCSFSSLSDQVKSLNQLCQNNRVYQIKIIYLSISIMFLVSTLYFVMSTSSKYSGTLGKILFKIKVVSNTNQRISLLQSFTREIFWILSGIAGIIAIYIPIFDTLRTLMLIFIIAESSRLVYSITRKSFHDEIAQTQVVRQ
jgi:uncharacterized RDD family membrane protein YckC